MSRCYTHSRGHLIYTENGTNWFWDDNNEPYIDDRECINCGLKAELEGPDPCLGMLPGVKYACCGHGIPGQDYVLLDNGERVDIEEYKRRIPI